MLIALLMADYWLVMSWWLTIAWLMLGEWSLVQRLSERPSDAPAAVSFTQEACEELFGLATGLFLQAGGDFLVVNHRG